MSGIFIRPSHSAPIHSDLRHIQFEAELRAGCFDATEADLSALDLPTHVCEPGARGAAGRPARDRARARQLSRMRLYMTGRECRGVAIRADERAERFALRNAARFPALSANQAALSARGRVPPLIGAGSSGTDGIQRDIRQMQAEIARMRAGNAELERHVELLTKAQETLAFEECALLSLAGIDRVALDFERRREEQQQTVKQAMQILEARVAAPLPSPGAGPEQRGSD
jgi:hypothetical protein